MAENAPEERPVNLLESVSELLETGTIPQARAMLNALHPAEIAHLIESFPSARRMLVWELVDDENAGEVLLHVNDEVRSTLIEEMDESELLAATGGMDMDDLADFLHDLPARLIGDVLYSLDQQNRQRLESVMSWPEDTAGGLMNTDTVTVRPDVTLDVVLRYLRRRRTLPDHTDSLFVANRHDRYLGILPVSALLTGDPTQRVAEVLDRDMEAIPAGLDATEVARRFEARDLVSAPVVDDDSRLLGRITIDDVVDVIRDEAERSVLNMAGLSEEEDLFAPVLASARRRAIWLGINLLTAFLAAWVIGLFEGTIEKVVALAVLMPVVASMGGIAGTQTLTLVIRALALGQVGSSNARALLYKELGIGMLNGLLWALIVAGVAVAWFGHIGIGVVIAAAMCVNLLFAALSGVGVPLLLKRIGVDPALAGGVVLTTVTDVVGFTAFLGLATMFLL